MSSSCAARLRHLLVALSRTTLSFQRDEGCCCGVSLAQCHMLAEVGARRRQPPSVGEIAEALGVELSTASRVADGLVKQGLLDRRASQSDRRRVALALTAAGERTVTAIDEGMAALATRVLAHFPKRSRATLLTCLTELLAAIDAAADDPCCSQDAANQAQHVLPAKKKGKAR